MRALLTVFLLLFGMVSYAEDLGEKIEATTANGDKVILHPDGRWQFVDTKKAIKAAEVAKLHNEEPSCPPGTKSGLFGLGRCIPVGDKDYNRGSLSGKGW